MAEKEEKLQAPVTVTAEDIVAALRAAGIEAGDIIMVHSSLKSFGHVEGGAETVVDALLEAVGEKGTVIVPTLSASYNRGTASGIPFNPKTTPSRVGIITETLRKRPGAIRSGHPTHSVTATGPAARELTGGHWPGSTFTINGPYGRYVKAGAKIVFLGAPMTSNTTLHAVEEWLGLPYMQKAEAVMETADGGSEIVEVTQAPLDHRDFYSRTGRIHEILEKAGAVTTVKLNDTVIKVLPAKKVVRVMAEAELEHPGVLLCDREECAFCRKGREDILKMQGEIRRNYERLKEEGYTDIS
ncbi:MAG: AAC(3) family N-acetyltransferase [Planctomycetes bacterium]|nr:AAC(3) family N-acetyltransferase [Planctomycetota bacterium]